MDSSRLHTVASAATPAGTATLAEGAPVRHRSVRHIVDTYIYILNIEEYILTNLIFINLFILLRSGCAVELGGEMGPEDGAEYIIKK
jgi:hypothetical protein